MLNPTMPPKTFALRVLIPLNAGMAAIATWLLVHDPWCGARLPDRAAAGIGLFLTLFGVFCFLTLLLQRTHHSDLRGVLEQGTEGLETRLRTQSRVDRWSAVIAASVATGALVALRVPPHLYCLVGLPFLVSVLVLQDWRHTHIEEALAQARDRALQAGLAPHFAFNTLSTLKGQVNADPEEACATIDRMARLLREAVAMVEEVSVPLSREVAFVESYLGLERARLGSRLQVRIEVDEHLDRVPVPPMALQVLVENAIRHGVAPLPEGGLIQIKAESEGPWLRLSVEDPGHGEGGQPGSGQALSILRRRLGRPEAIRLEVLPGAGHRASLLLRRP